MRVLVTILLSIGLSQFCFAQSNSSTVYRFLDLSPQARAAALGGNHVGLYNGNFSLFHVNPAYLSDDDAGHGAATYINYLADANIGSSTAAFHIKGLGTVGAGVRYVNYGDFDRLNEQGEDLGDFRAYDLAFTGVYAHSLPMNIQAGASFDLIHSSYDTYSASAVALNGGLFYQDSTRAFSAGLAIRNLGLQLSSFQGRNEPLPLDISLGLSKKPESFPFHLQFTLKRLNDWDLRVFGEKQRPGFAQNLMRHVLFGGEATLAETVQLRFGYDHYLREQTGSGDGIQLAGVAFGIGFSVRSVQIDISRNSYSDLGGITRISIQTAFN